MIRELGDGKTSLTPIEAATLLKGLANQPRKRTDLQTRMIEAYGNQSDLQIFFESLIAKNYLGIFFKEAGQYSSFVEGLTEATRVQEMQVHVTELNNKLGIQLEDSALKNIRDVQKGLGLIELMQELVEKKGWDFTEAIKKAERWTAKELVDLRFDVVAEKQPERLTEVLADQVRIQFALSVLESVLRVYGDRTHSTFKNIEAYFSTRVAYEDHIDGRISAQSEVGEWGIVASVLVGLGGRICHFNGGHRSPLSACSLSFIQFWISNLDGFWFNGCWSLRCWFL